MLQERDDGTDLGLGDVRQQLSATVRSWNAPSFRVLEKNGFRRDHVVTDDRGTLVYMVRDP